MIISIFTRTVWAVIFTYFLGKRMETNGVVLIMLIGLLGGVLSGMLGIGGGVVLVPALVGWLAYSQKTAQGTTLAMLMFPVVALGVLNYHQQGHVQWRTAILMAIGFVVGGWLGSKFTLWLPEHVHIGHYGIAEPAKKLFALALIIIALRILLK